MDCNKPELSSRYYKAELTVILLSTILIIDRFIGLAPAQTLPIINVSLKMPQYLPPTIAIMLVLVVVYLIIEWNMSSADARISLWARFRVWLTCLFAFAALWLDYPNITRNTVYIDISPAWYLVYTLLGIIIGIVTSILFESTLMIRTLKESSTLELPRIPAAAFSQYMVFIPILLLLISAYYMIYYFSPSEIKWIGCLIVITFYGCFIIGTIVSLSFRKDENGKRIPYAKFVAQLKAINDFHDNTLLLIDQSSTIAKKMDIPPQASPEEIQQTLKERFAKNSSVITGRFRCQHLDEINISMYPKDGNPDNLSTNNLGIKIIKHQGDKEYFRVLVIFENTEDEPQEIKIPLSAFEANAEEYLSIHNDDEEAFSIERLISYAGNKFVKEILINQNGSLLHRAVESGRQDLVVELLNQEIDVNAKAEYGWTALLYASAQGYPRIMELLLDAGANPDIGNLQGITPLMYGVRYNNFKICKILLDHGADANLQDKFGVTALMVGVGHNNLEICKILLEHDADVNLQDREGITALMIASFKGYIDVAEKLINKGANTSIKDNQGRTALDLAHDYKQGKIARILRKSKRSKKG